MSTEAVFDPQDSAVWLDHIKTYGYVVIHHAVPQENLDAVLADLMQHTGASLDDPESWYRPDIIRPGGMVEMYHYQSMWDNRQSQSLYDIFRAIHGTEKLSVSIDRVGFKPPVDPAHPEYDNVGMIHWDADMAAYPHVPFHVQGVLALTDTEPDMGGFQCIPETYQDLDNYLKTQTAEQIASRNPDYSGYTITHPRLAAGDLIVWTTQLLHGNGHNTSHTPRFCQYISMNPAISDPAAVEQRVDVWRHNTHPAAPAFPGDPRGIEEARTEPAQLTELGRKLLGVDPWE